MDTIDPLRFILAFVFVLGLIGAMGMGFKRYGHRLSTRGLFALPQEAGRLKVIETRWLDTKRKLVLVSRDDVEHLLLISDKSELLIESVGNTQNH